MQDNKNSQIPAVELLRSVWRETDALGIHREGQVQQPEQNQLIASIFSNGPYYFYVFDLANLGMLRVGGELEDIHGYSPEDVTFQDVLQAVHPDDMPFVTRAEETAIRLFQDEIGLEQVLNYKISYCFRMRTRDGSYRLFNHQAIVLSIDDSGGIGRALNVHTDISHLVAENNYRLSLIGMNGSPSFLNIDVEGEFGKAASKPSPFTERETTIIRLIGAGLTSGQIATELNLSEFTIKNHRKRILKKVDCQNMSQLLSTCITEGLI